MRHSRFGPRTGARIAALALLATAGGLCLSTASATVEPGTPAKDVHIGLDDDNADNPFIQPAGVSKAQHMNDTDVLFGRDNDDLLIGRLGGDTLLGGPDADILVGGPDLGHRKSNDVLVGDEGNDITIWSPGDGNDAVVGNDGYDTMVFGPLALDRHGSPRLTSYHGRQVPHVRVDGYPRLSCTLTRFPAASQPGFQYLVRLSLDDVQTASVREKDIERVLCPGPRPGTVRVAIPHGAHPHFHTRSLSSLRGVVGAITEPAG